MINKEFNSNTTLDLLAASSQWMLERHKWLIDNMRSILTGEQTPLTNHLSKFESIVPNNISLPNNLLQSIHKVQSTLDEAWHAARKASHPLSGATVFEQLNQYQKLVHDFLQLTQEANHQLWHDFTMRDALTGAWSRNALETNLKHELIRANRDKNPSTIAMLDQNNFKAINDKWGHIVGDKVLAKTAELIHNNLRPNDKLFRYGGDEWLILMPMTSQENALAIIERIQKAYAQHAFEFSGDNGIFYTTFSFGIAELRYSDNVEIWVDEADRQLYAKKAKSH